MLRASMGATDAGWEHALVGVERCIWCVQIRSNQLDIPGANLVEIDSCTKNDPSQVPSIRVVSRCTCRFESPHIARGGSDSSSLPKQHQQATRTNSTRDVLTLVNFQQPPRTKITYSCLFNNQHEYETLAVLFNPANTDNQKPKTSF